MISGWGSVIAEMISGYGKSMLEKWFQGVGIPDHPNIISKMISRGGGVQPPECWGDMKHIRSLTFQPWHWPTLETPRNRAAIIFTFADPLWGCWVLFFFTIHISKFRVNQTMAMIQCALWGHKLWSIWEPTCFDTMKHELQQCYVGRCFRRTTPPSDDSRSDQWWHDDLDDAGSCQTCR